MGRRRRTAAVASALVAVTVVALITIPAAIAAFGARAQNAGDTVTAAPDFTPPAITATVVAKGQGGVTGFVHKGGAYFVYANVAADTGSPASGLATVRANAAELTGGQAEAALSAGTYTAGGFAFNYRSAELTATTAVEGSRSYSVTATDKAGNARAVQGTATVDNVVPKAADVQTANGGATVGRAEERDTITFTFSEPIDPQSILAGWNGAATSVVVRLYDNGLLGLALGNDELFVYDAANSARLPFGAVDLGRGDYVAGLLGGAIYFGATGTKSTMVMSGNAVTLTFGTESPGGLLVAPRTAAGTGSMTWTPAATPYDRAGNAMAATAVTESGAAGKGF